MTINQLMELTGKSFRTVKKKIESLKPVREDGRAGHYSTVDALKLIYATAVDKANSELAKETLLLERARREKLEIEIGKLRGDLVAIDEVVKVVEKEYSFVRSQVRSLPSKLAKPLSMVTDPNEVYTRLSDGVDELLTELTADSKYEHDRQQLADAARKAIEAKSEADASSITQTESGSMGGSVSVSEPGSE